LKENKLSMNKKRVKKRRILYQERRGKKEKGQARAGEGSRGTTEKKTHFCYGEPKEKGTPLAKKRGPTRPFLRKRGGGGDETSRLGKKKTFSRTKRKGVRHQTERIAQGKEK